MEFLLVLLVLGAVAVVVAWPLYRAARPRSEPDRSPEVEALELARDAKLREIRDAEMDRRTGKLSDEDWRDLDARLREEAIVLLRELDEAEAAEPPPGDARDDHG